MKFAALLPALAVCFSGFGCAHMVHIESAPGAEIYVNDQHVGTAPATYQETTGTSDAVRVTAKLHGKEKTITVPRDNIDMGPIGAGAGVGAGACMAGLGVSVVAALVFLPCAFVTAPLSWVALGVGPGAGWWYSHKMPDSVKVDFDDEPDHHAAIKPDNDDQPAALATRTRF